VPLADGGVGTIENMVASSNGEIKYTRVCGPLKHIVDAAYGVL
jgi:glycerate kinase